MLEGVCFSEDKLESYSQLLASMIRSDGFIEVAQIIPFHFEDHQVKKFLKDGGIDSVRVEDGFCFS